MALLHRFRNGMGDSQQSNLLNLSPLMEETSTIDTLK